MHKAIVCTRCDFFDRACNGSFKVVLPSTALSLSAHIAHLSPYQEARDGQIELHDDPEVVDAVLRYIYTGAYDEDRYFRTFAELERTNPIVLDVRVYNAADKYNLPGLGKLARQKFARRVEKAWATSAFADAVYEVYTGSYIVADNDYGDLVEHESLPSPGVNSFTQTTTRRVRRNSTALPTTMRRTIISTAMSHLATFATSQSPSIAALRSLLYTIPAFAADLCMAQLQIPSRIGLSSPLSSSLRPVPILPPSAIDPVITANKGGTGDCYGGVSELYCCPKCEREFVVRDPEMEIEFVCPRIGCDGRVGWDERLEESRN